MSFVSPFWRRACARAVRLVLVLGLVGCMAAAQAASPTAFDTLRLDQLQLLGSHNSYRPYPSPAAEARIRAAATDPWPTLAYGHPPLEAQLALGLHQFEIDVLADPAGGRFLPPDAAALPADVRAELQAPGAKTLHHPDSDTETHCRSFRACLAVFARWCDAHPHHDPVVVLVNSVDFGAADGVQPPVVFDQAGIDALEADIAAVIGPARVITPDSVRQGHATLRDAVLSQAWPRWGDARGRFLFVLDGSPAHEAFLRHGHPSLAGRLMFGFFDAAEPEAAVMNVQDPIDEGARIRALVQAGFLVRTRADAGGVEARAHDRRRQQAAIASGAQWVSTDFYAGVPDPLGLGHVVDLDGAAVRCNAARAVCPPTRVDAPQGMTLERVVVLARHGVRAPLDGEAAVARWLPQPMARFSTPASQITPHGAAAVKRLAAFDRAWLVEQGLLPAHGCPKAGDVRIHANASPRAIDSARLAAATLAPGCALAVTHVPLGEEDPLFHPLEAHAVPFDADAAVAAIGAETGGPAAIAAPERAAFEMLQAILGCGASAPAPLAASPACAIADVPARLQPNAAHDGIALAGPIDLASGTAQVLALQYAEGLPMSQVGWGRASRAQLTALSRLHALLFEVHARPAVMARSIGGPMARRLLELLNDAHGPKLALMVGHDNNIVALAGLLGAHFQIDSYGRDDPPPGGALALQLWRDGATGTRFVRAVYEAQTLDQLRALTPLTLRRPPVLQTLHIDGCPADGSTGSDGLCRLDDMTALLTQRLGAR